MSEIQYFDCTEGDFNDVYDRFYLRGTWEQVEEYIKECFNSQERSKMEDIGGGSDICFGYYYPVTDENGNEIPETDPRYEEESENQELRLAYYISAVPMDDKEEKFVDKDNLHDLTVD